MMPGLAQYMHGVDYFLVIPRWRLAMFFESWLGLARTIVVGIFAYAGLILMLRISGKRTLSKLNSFDFIVTVALGSTLATILLSKDVALAEGLVAFALLILLQFVVTWSSVRSNRVRRMVRAEPRVLWYQAEFIDAAMRSERVTQSEVMQAVRSAGVSSMREVAAVVMETDGTMAVVRGGEENRSATALNDAVEISEQEFGDCLREASATIYGRK